MTDSVSTNERYILIAGGDGYTSMIVEGRAAMERAFLKLHWDPIDFISLTDEQRELLAVIRDEDEWATDALHGRISFDVKHEDGWVRVYRLVNPLPGFAPEPPEKCPTCHDTGRQFVGYSGRDDDGNAPEFVRCEECGYGDESGTDYIREALAAYHSGDVPLLESAHAMEAALARAMRTLQTKPAPAVEPRARVYQATKLLPYETRWFHTEGMAEKLGYTVDAVWERLPETKGEQHGS